MKRPSNSLWFFALVGIWGGLMVGSWVFERLPASRWLVVGPTHVESAPSGTCNPMEVDREIKRPFFGRWSATLLRQKRDGTYAFFRVFDGQNDYRPGTELPDELDLGWWLFIDECSFPPGTYRVNTVWIIRPFSEAPRYVRRESNPFEITSYEGGE